ncbi:MAG: peptidylprolyl isomerase [Muribaculaceae bacterium]|nr:peptidylprolyl isomerase [Muribaculaceae bacterium]
MNKILLSASLILSIGGMMSAAKPQVDPADRVLMTIDKKPVTVGEFEYLYNKNNSQQLVPQTIEQYLDMFINYKLKVAEAIEAGIDTTATFRKEYEGYVTDLAQPFLVDKELEQKLIDQEYERLKEEVDVSHIMLPLGQSAAEHEQLVSVLDSLRTVIANGNDTFENVAADYTIDRNTKMRGGRMGYITAMKFPYTFEDAAYNTPVGQLSQIIETAFGIHLVKVNDRRPARGQVLVQHILKLTRGMSPEQAAAQKVKIDSIHALLAAGADFDDVATRESEDPGSARQGGRLPWFSTGQMVKPFEDVSFALADGQLSDVITTDFGYHIIKRLDHKGVDSKEQLTPTIKETLSRDERGMMPRRAKLDELRERYHLTMNRPAVAMVESVIKSNGGYDSAVIRHFAPMDAKMATFDGGVAVKLNDIVATLSPLDGVPAHRAYELFTDRMNAMIDDAIVRYAVTQFADENAEYRNLINEYRDGILLFEISDRNVWSRAKDDTEGLNKWFDEHRDRYTWPAPKFKSYIIFATSDSILKAAHNYLADNQVAGNQLAQVLRQQFGHNVRVERVIAAKGENKIIDYLAFDGHKPAPQGKWIAYEAYQPVILEAPAEVADDRGAITADYQTYLEEQWIKKLRSSHNVKVDKKLLKSLSKSK